MLAGRAVADVVTNLLSIIVLVITGLIVGFSFNASPLTFLSSAFVPTDSMPDGLRHVAEANPVSAIVDAVRKYRSSTSH